jgi:hypothetical protein
MIKRGIFVCLFVCSFGQLLKVMLAALCRISHSFESVIVVTQRELQPVGQE